MRPNIGRRGAAAGRAHCMFRTADAGMITLCDLRVLSGSCRLENPTPVVVVAR
jgi:hypothetical protein